MNLNALYYILFLLFALIINAIIINYAYDKLIKNKNSNIMYLILFLIILYFSIFIFSNFIMYVFLMLLISQ
jgi:hypothetical protein